MDDTRARFLTAIAGRLGADRIVELHLFSPIRQGVLETGVAVIAVTPGGEEAGAQWGAEPQGGAEAAAQWGAEAQAQWDAGAGDDEHAAAEQRVAEAEATESTDSPYLTLPADPTVPVNPADSVHPTEPVPEDLSLPEHPTVPLHPTVPADRLVVFTARYRLTRKGPDRGKWLFECGATADAPLAAVDAVARGVTQRSKDLTETERLSGDQLRTLLQDPAWRMPA